MKNLLSILFVAATNMALWAQPEVVSLYHIYELDFQGPFFQTTDNPVRDIELVATWRHESGSPSYRIHGFYDGDGKGGAAGNLFKIRFTPTKPGQWVLVNVSSNAKQLDHQREGHTIRCTESDHPGFWIPDPESAGERWYHRSNGSHPYIVGNTMYTFLSEHGKYGPNGSNIRKDVRDNATYYNKLRFALTGDLYPHPTEKPFLDREGKPTDDGNYSHRPNPKWFTERVDLAVAEAFDRDMIADLILNGPDSPDGRSNLYAAENGNDPTPFLRYIAARYGSYPNVWICLSNEYDIRRPKFTAEQINVLGHHMKSLLPYPTPLSIHGNQRDWEPQLNTFIPWNDHVIFQNKLKRVWMAADKTDYNYWRGEARQPVINDELAYQGAGDGWNEEEVLMAFLGTFLGGGYGSTGHKPGSKLGGYFAGNFNFAEHSASDNLLWFRQIINDDISFWQMEPFTIFYSRPDYTNIHIFRHVDYHHRLLANPGHEYVLGGSGKQEGILAKLPEGKWAVQLYDLAAMEKRTLNKAASGDFSFDFPDSKAVFVHLKRVD